MLSKGQENTAKLWINLHYIRLAEYFVYLQYYDTKVCQLKYNSELLSWMRKELTGRIKRKYLKV